MDAVMNNQFSSVQLLSLVRLCDPMNCSTPGLPVHHQQTNKVQRSALSFNLNPFHSFRFQIQSHLFYFLISCPH